MVVIGFRPQHRDQTHGTFKLVFNALFNGPPAVTSDIGRPRALLTRQLSCSVRP